MPHKHHISPETSRLKWSNATPPVLTVLPGETVTFDLLDSSGAQITHSSTTADLKALDLSTFDPIFGPVYISGAEPGDVLEIEVLSLETAGWGFTAIFPNFGLLAAEFPDTHLLKHYTWSASSSSIEFKPGVNIPLRPFLGVAGIAPADPGEFSTIPPLDTGGNIDCKHVTQGSKLYLPVKVPGALFSCGDGHAAQGDGEVCGTAIETPMKATLRFNVRKDMPYVTSPHYDTRGSVHGGAQSDPAVYAVLGIDPDLLEASRKALRSLIAHLVATRHLTREEAYMLCSVAADLKIAEIVDLPNFAVSASIPYSIFSD
ncbi:putative formamidase [Colletotrichum orbiculare MAFF 240422]|uniref:Formamidase n=1 Tax=Colletotrichum orbiculare (strain 104-T / ATCC 96160 / CBS 514.97 / LARS 414 / MAFF 240422) TaxID=1213857 RepID=N4VLA4_COLOR|nr:putative formamidase [Colletotrichum orbiculare MAFF 240422]